MKIILFETPPGVLRVEAEHPPGGVNPEHGLARSHGDLSSLVL